MPQLLSVTNDYILNLSVADLAFVLTLPFFCYATVMGDWPFGEVACRLTYAVRETNCFASVYTLVALSIDRYLASFPHSKSPANLRTARVARMTCVVIWLVCGLLTTPYLLYANVIRQSAPVIRPGQCPLTAGGEGGPLLMQSPRRLCRFMWPGDQFNYKVSIISVANQTAAKDIT